jgi:hypothetical protein
MIELQTVLSVVVLFMVRIGIPILLVVALGILVDRWQSRRDAEAEQYRQEHKV